MANTIKFLGTAGARFVVARQLRASGGLWLSLSDTNLLIDPGPGTLVKCATSRPKLDPAKLDAIILTHRHLDHSSDINIMIEAMTEGGFKRRGYLFAPEDALSDDPVILRYVRGFVESIETLQERGEYSVGKVRFNTPVRHVHGVETYGLNLRTDALSLSFIIDTRYFEGLEDHYNGDVVVLNLVRYKEDERGEIDHLNVSDAEKLIGSIRPKVAIISHFGMTMIRARPWEVAAGIKERTGVEVIAARDGMEFDIDTIYS
ncbi:MAG TPA: MBL fold metallo-hydrolase [Candidatus Latescibacteria bacterium]|nr:MBL fold metallo-hydrolase [Candidatus Latescibacterota bacterium]